MANKKLRKLRRAENRTWLISYLKLDPTNGCVSNHQICSAACLELGWERPHRDEDYNKIRMMEQACRKLNPDAEYIDFKERYPEPSSLQTWETQ